MPSMPVSYTPASAHACTSASFSIFCKKVTHVHVEAAGTVFDLRNSQIDQFDKRRRKVALHHVSVHAAKDLDASGATWF
jgi:hypothetical protein